MGNVAKIVLFALVLRCLVSNNTNRAAAIGAIKSLPGVKDHYDFIDVYDRIPTADKNGRTNLTFAQNMSGVYAIAENNRVVYVGKSLSNLYRTIMRHFQVWVDERHGEQTGDPNRLTYRNQLSRNNYTVSIWEITGNNNIFAAESVLIEHFDPRDNIREELSSLPDNSETIAAELIEEDFSDVPF